MDRNYRVFSDGRLERHNDTVRLVTVDDETKCLPIEKAKALYLHGQVEYNTRLMSFLKHLLTGEECEPFKRWW